MVQMKEQHQAERQWSAPCSLQVIASFKRLLCSSVYFALLMRDGLGLLSCTSSDLNTHTYTLSTPTQIPSVPAPVSLRSPYRRLFESLPNSARASPTATDSPAHTRPSHTSHVSDTHTNGDTQPNAAPSTFDNGARARVSATSIVSAPTGEKGTQHSNTRTRSYT